MRILPRAALFVVGVAIGILIGNNWSQSTAGDLLTVSSLFLIGLFACSILIILGLVLRTQRIVPRPVVELQQVKTPSLTPDPAYSPSGLSYGVGAKSASLEASTIFEPFPSLRTVDVVASRSTALEAESTVNSRRFSTFRRNGNWVVRVQNFRPYENLEMILTLPSLPQVFGRIPILGQVDFGPAQSWLFTAGLGFAVLGQVVVNRSQPIVSFQSLYDTLDDTFRLQFPNREAPLEGFLLLVLGGVLFSLAVGGIRIWKSASDSGQDPAPQPRSKPMSRLSVWGLPGVALVLTVYVWQVLGDKSYESYLPILWLGSFALLGVFFRKLDRERGISLKIPFTKQEAIFLSLIVIAGFVVLAYNITDTPSVIWGDEGAHYEVAYGIAQGRPDANIFDFGVYSFPLLHSFYVALFLKLFGYSIFSWRLSSIVAGVAALVPTYFLGRDLFNKRVGYLSAILMIASPLYLVYGRMGYHLILSVFPVVAALWLFHIAWQRHSLFFAFLSGLINGMGMYSYSPVQAGIFIVAIYGLYLLVTRRIKFRTIATLGLVYGVTVILAYGPHIVWGMAASPETLSYKTAEGIFNNVFQVRALFGDQDPFQYYPPINVYGQVLFFNPPLYAKILIRAVLRTLVAFNDESLMRDHFLTTSMAGPIASVFFLLGMIYVHFKIRKEEFGLLAIWFWLCFLLLNVLNQEPPRPTHSMPLIPLLAIVTALTLVLVAEYISRRAPKLLAWGSIGAVVLAIVILGMRQYFVIAQDQVRPELESLMTWAEIDARAPTKVVYIYGDDPQHYLYAPWAIEHLNTQATFELVAIKDFVEKESDLPPGVQYDFFAQPEVADEALALLTQAYAGGQSQQYFAYGGRYIGLSYKVAR